MILLAHKPTMRSGKKEKTVSTSPGSRGIDFGLEDFNVPEIPGVDEEIRTRSSAQTPQFGPESRGLNEDVPRNPGRSRRELRLGPRGIVMN
ncbi:MAG TPA: hypothetical protein VD907_03895 [Verrucomicrobiae bacterium]|nr:hypothetical protein [Verrucomicrobiae bacterium]